MLKGMKVIDRYNLASMLPEKGGLHTQLIVQKLREKLLMNADEVEALGMTTGVVHIECGNPVQNKGTEEDPKYYCLMCNDFVEDVRGKPGHTIWNQDADVGVDIELKKAERGVLIQAFAELDKEEDVSAAHAVLWNMLAAGYPKAFTPPEDDEEN